jgi:hypothetical protein
LIGAHLTREAPIRQSCLACYAPLGAPGNARLLGLGNPRPSGIPGDAPEILEDATRHLYVGRGSHHERKQIDESGKLGDSERYQPFFLFGDPPAGPVRATNGLVHRNKTALLFDHLPAIASAERL